MWKAPFLNGPSRGVAERVPSGATTSETPSPSLRTAGSSWVLAFAVSPRSMKTMPARSKICPITGTVLTSFLAMPVKSRLSSWMMTAASSFDWWLKTKTQGLLEVRWSSPSRTRTRTPLSRRPRSLPRGSACSMRTSGSRATMLPSMPTAAEATNDA